MPDLLVIGIDPSLTALGISDGVSHNILYALQPLSDEERAASTRRRTRDLAAQVADWIGERDQFDSRSTRRIVVYIEAPLLSSMGGGANHLYELGQLIACLYDYLEDYAERIVEVPSSTVRKFATGKGNTPKTQMALQVFKRFGIEFEKDPGCDKLFAYALHRYGLAVESGEVQHVAPLRRGAGKKSRAIVAKREKKAA